MPLLKNAALGVGLCRLPLEPGLRLIKFVVWKRILAGRCTIQIQSVARAIQPAGRSAGQRQPFVRVLVTTVISCLTGRRDFDERGGNVAVLTDVRASDWSANERWPRPPQYRTTRSYSRRFYPSCIAVRLSFFHTVDRFIPVRAALRLVSNQSNYYYFYCKSLWKRIRNKHVFSLRRSISTLRYRDVGSLALKFKSFLRETPPPSLSSGSGHA